MPIAKLRIPAGWSVQGNVLSEPSNDSDLPPYEDLTEDLLQLEHTERRVIVDLSWLPEFSPAGRFVLMAIARPADGEDLPDAWDRPLRVFETQSYAQMRDTIEAWLEDQSHTASK